MSHGENKGNLARYYTQYVKENAPSLLKDGQTIFISGGQEDQAFGITYDGVKEVGSLCSNQEEADTRIILHAVAAATDGAETIEVWSCDTDVLDLLMHYRPAIMAYSLYTCTCTHHL